VEVKRGLRRLDGGLRKVDEGIQTIFNKISFLRDENKQGFKCSFLCHRNKEIIISVYKHR
jgi:hypothetical protein